MNTTQPRIFAISDLHLSGAQPDKQMDVFGAHWEHHWERIQADWHNRVQPEDIVLIPGDISWAMSLAQAQEDLAQIAALPGQKCILRGNHDYWWSAIGRLRALLPEGMYALQNDALCFDGVTICGTRGWVLPNQTGISSEDEKVYLREVQRLALSLEDGRCRAPEQKVVVMMHYPPFNEQKDPSGFTELLTTYMVSCVVYGHLHGPSLRHVFQGRINGVEYRMVSCDFLRFQLAELAY